MKQHGIAMALCVFASVSIMLVGGTNWGTPPSAGANITMKIVNVTPSRQLLPFTSLPQLRGVDRSGTEYACIEGWGYGSGPYDLASVQAIRSWDVTTVRVPLNEDCWLDINVNGTGAESYSGASYRAFIISYVALLESQGIRPILDLHWNAPGVNQSAGQQPMADEDHGPAFWMSVAYTFRNDSNVIFDLYNEPHDISWDCWLNGCFQTFTNPGWQTAGMRQLLDVVRSTGADTQLVILGGLNWSNDLSGWLSHEPTDPAGPGLLGASLHMYEGQQCSGWNCWNSTFLPLLSAGIPIITGELGQTDTDCNPYFIDLYFAWADPVGVSYLGWAWTTFANCTSPTLIADYTGTPYMAYGTAFRDHLLNLSILPASVPSVPLGETVTAGDSSVMVNWKAPVSNGTFPVDNYTVAWGTSPSSLTQSISTGPVKSLGWDVQSLTNGQTYYFAVRAFNGVGFSPRTTPIAGTPEASLATITSVMVTPSSKTLSVGGTAVFTATPSCSGGTCPSGITYSWTLSSTLAKLNTTIGASVNITAGSSSGTVGLFVNATLKSVATQSSPVIITISTTPTLNSVAIAPSSATIEIGGTTAPFTATPRCSTTCPAGTTYSWTLTTPSMGTLNSSTSNPVAFTARNTIGTVGLFLNATLGSATVQSSPVVITVTSTPPPTLTSVAVVPTTGAVSAGGTTSPFTATPTCSAACPSGISYSWTLTNIAMGSLSSTSANPVTFTSASTPGTVALFVNATLGSATERSAPVIITISSTSPPTLISIAVNPSSPTISTVTTTPFSATPTCSAACPAGTAYSWTLSNSSMGKLNSTTGNPVTFTAGNVAGTVTLFVNATLNGRTASSRATVTVSKSQTTPPSSNSFFSGTTLIVIVLVVVVVAAIAVAAFLMSRRKNSRVLQSQGPAPPSPAPTGQASPTWSTQPAAPAPAPAPVPSPASPAPSAAPPSPPAPPQSELLCPRCGTRNLVEYSFCKSCATPLPH